MFLSGQCSPLNQQNWRQTWRPPKQWARILNEMKNSLRTILPVCTQLLWSRDFLKKILPRRFRTYFNRLAYKRNKRELNWSFIVMRTRVGYLNSIYCRQSPPVSSELTTAWNCRIIAPTVTLRFVTSHTFGRWHHDIIG